MRSDRRGLERPRLDRNLPLSSRGDRDRLTPSGADTNLTRMSVSQTSRDGGDPEGNPLSADQVRQIVLVRAFEEADPEGRLLPLSSRRQATQSARKQHDSGPAIAERASQLSRTLSEKFSSLGWVHRLAPGASMFSPVLFLLALAFGFLHIFQCLESSGQVR